MPPEPDTQPPRERRIHDLEQYQNRQAALYRALAQYQHAAAGEALVHPGAFGLAVVCRFDSTEETVEALLLHEGGGELSSGPLTLASNWLEQASAQAVGLLLNPLTPAIAAPEPSTPPKAQEPAPVEITEGPAPEPEPACPMPAPPAPALTLPAQQPAEQPAELIIQGTATLQQPPAPAVEPEQQPEPEEVEEVLSALDEINAKAPDALKAILAAYKAAHPIGRTPFVKSLTSRARLATIRQLITENQP
jgi:hypothetical protein